MLDRERAVTMGRGSSRALDREQDATPPVQDRGPTEHGSSPTLGRAPNGTVGRGLPALGRAPMVGRGSSRGREQDATVAHARPAGGRRAWVATAASSTLEEVAVPGQRGLASTLEEAAATDLQDATAASSTREEVAA
ncbi:MAG: hypothetical protein KC636_32645, partial [Myxococcales bacterium]|nr:hypothetical protein [Myxococcales bacterium]